MKIDISLKILSLKVTNIDPVRTKKKKKEIKMKFLNSFF